MLSFLGLKRYKILSLIGDGTYGLVYLATNVETAEKVAIKSMKRRYHSWDEVTDLREVKSLKKLHHPNVVKLKEVIRENSRLYFIFEYVRGDLLGLMREKPNEHFPEFWIRSVIQQVLQVIFSYNWFMSIVVDLYLLGNINTLVSTLIGPIIHASTGFLSSRPET